MWWRLQELEEMLKSLETFAKAIGCKRFMAVVVKVG